MWIIKFILYLSIIKLISANFSYYDTFEKAAHKAIKDPNKKNVIVDFIADFIKYNQKELVDTTPTDGQEYDFIIVGAGSAGATIASRLSEITGWKILLIEAGAHEFLLMHIPIVALLLQLDRGWNWHYYTEASNDYCRGFIDKQCRVAMGRVLGGTSAINMMIAVRGNRYDYNEWAEATGDDNWSHRGMLKSFKKLEKFEANLADFKSRYHNFDGPVHIANARYHTPLAEAFIKAGEELGYSNVDYNGPSQIGFSYMQTNQINGERMSSNRAYLHSLKGKKRTLYVSMNSHVNKVLIDRKTKTAYGVEFVKNGKKIRVKAKKEVILSAGAIGSPKILMLSGIGPKNHLEDLGLNVLQDLPVGENMMDHIGCAMSQFTVNQSVSVVPGEFFNSNDHTIYDYLAKRTGKMATVGGAETIAYINVDDPGSNRPNAELLFASMTFSADSTLHIPFGLPEKAYEEMFAPKLHHHGYIIWPILMKPKSRGKLLLRSTDPKDKPKLIPNYLSHPDDVRIAIKAVRKAVEVSKTKAYQKYGSELLTRKITGCEKYEFDTDDYWECAWRTYTITFWHHSGTCKMGREEDPTTVVNSRLQVKGIKKLRVADASIMPDIVTAHLNIPSIAIGEKFADILKKDYGYNTDAIDNDNDI